jgi:hypothetical protein
LFRRKPFVRQRLQLRPSLGLAITGVAGVEALGVLVKPKRRPACVENPPLQVRPKPDLHEVAAVVPSKQVLDHSSQDLSLQVFAHVFAKAAEFAAEEGGAPFEQFSEQ